MKPIIRIDSIGKQYRLGMVGTGTLMHDFNRWWYRILGKEDPYLEIGETNDRTKAEGSDYVWVLKDINLEVQSGEILGIIGKNGAGKSTLLKILSRITAPTTGKITCFGKVASLLEVGTGFHNELTGKENIYLNGAILGMTKKEIAAKFNEIVTFAGCGKYINTPVKRYSSGMYVRLAFAVAAHLEPDILIVDEVLAVGDAEFQKKAIGKMKEVSKTQGRTVLFVSHNMASIQSLCNRLLVLNQGQIVFKGNVNEGIEYYMNSSIEKSYLPLSKRKDRDGRGNLRFTDIKLRSENEMIISQIFSGKLVYVDLEVSTKIELQNLEFKITFLDAKGVIRFICNSQNSRYDNLNLIKKGHHALRCSIPEFPLPKGEYVIQLTCLLFEEIEDNIEAALVFNVAGGNFFKSGKEQQSEEGVLVKNSFHIL